MKKCPFCAEEIQDEAIKCKHCGSMLSAAPPRAAAAQAGDDAEPPATAKPAGAEAAPADAASPAGVAAQVAQTPAQLVASAGKPPGPRAERKTLYEGSPSWRAYFGAYVLVVAAGIAVPFGAQWIAARFEVSTLNRALAALIPLALAVVVFFGIHFWRKSMRFRISTSNIETESGLLAKKIDVLELWRCRDVRYKQSFADRLLGIAHIEVYTADITSPKLEIVGFPASRQLFEQIRDAIEIQRHAQNVVGFVQ